jgi:ubiquinone/menaquinone biosynthesis C-methylase UbiE
VHAWLASLADPGVGQRVADLGCGRGLALVELATRCPDAVLIGLDLKPGQLSEARETLRRAAADTGLLRADLAEHLPFFASSLDTAIPG